MGANTYQEEANHALSDEVFNSESAIGLQMQCTVIVSLFGILQKMMAYSYMMPGYGWAVGGILGIFSYYALIMTNEISIKGAKAHVVQRPVGYLEKLFSYICIATQISWFLVGDITCYEMIGEQLHYPVPRSVFTAMGWIAGTIGLIGAALYMLIMFWRYWDKLERPALKETPQEKNKREENEYESKRKFGYITLFFKTLAAIDHATQTGLSFIFMMPGPTGLTVGLIMGIASFFITSANNLQIIKFDLDDAYTKILKAKNPQLKNVIKIQVNTWKSNLFLAAAWFSTLINSVNYMVWYFVSFWALALSLNLGEMAFLGAFTVGGIVALASGMAAVIYVMALVERTWNVIRTREIPRPAEIPFDQLAMLPMPVLKKEALATQANGAEKTYLVDQIQFVVPTSEYPAQSNDLFAKKVSSL